MIHSFNAVIPDQPPRKLILGSLPGVASLAQMQYYAHPHNAFWRIIETLLANGEPCSYQERLDLLRHHRIALWDVVAAAAREGSLDSSIEAHTVVPNDIVGLLRRYPEIHTIYLNGGMAKTLFHRHVAKHLPREVAVMVLPSTSPANARMRFEQKLVRWQVVAE